MSLNIPTFIAVALVASSVIVLITTLMLPETCSSAVHIACIVHGSFGIALGALIGQMYWTINRNFGSKFCLLFCSSVDLAFVCSLIALIIESTPCIHLSIYLFSWAQLFMAVAWIAYVDAYRKIIYIPQEEEVRLLI